MSTSLTLSSLSQNLVMSYRAFKQSWSGYPLTSPSVAVNSSSAYASWNGATSVARWVLLGGANESSVMTQLANTTKTGFETQVGSVNSSFPFVAVAALGSDVRCDLPLSNKARR